VQGFNNKFTSATKFYQDLCGRLFDGPDNLDLYILYDWPSRGSILGYEPDNVWDIDCSSFFPPEVDGGAIHGAYFQNDGTINLMRHVLRGLDRGVLDALGHTRGTAWPGTK